MQFTILSATATDVLAVGDARDATRRLLGPFRSIRRTPVALESDSVSW